ncbi:MAG: radical SAM protein [Deltaproteobacteria bacterium]|nr:radical SAM protein [Deltaproteobacteria bacterium]
MRHALTRLQGLLRTAENLHQPLAASFSITRRCNEHCRICYLASGSRNEIGTNKALETVSELADLGTLFLTITGGEPLLRSDLEEIIERARDKGLAVKLLTNATLMDPTRARRLAGLGLLSVHVTMFSTREQLHDSITGLAGSLFRTRRGLDLLKAEGINLVIHTPLIKSNYAFRHEVEAFASELEAGWIEDANITPGEDGNTFEKDRLGFEQLKQVIAERDTAHKHVQAAITDEPLCAAGLRLLHVDSDGSVKPCIQDFRAAGNIFTQTLKDIWNNSELLRELRSRTRGDLDRVCANCQDIGLCGRCSAVALLETGNDLGPSPSACLEARAKKAVEMELGRLEGKM